VAEVPENLPAGTFVAHVTVADADSAEFGQVDCNLTDNAFSLVRRPDSTDFQVSFTQASCKSLNLFMYFFLHTTLLCRLAALAQFCIRPNNKGPVFSRKIKA